MLDSNYQGVKRLFVLAYDGRTNDDNADADSRVKVDSHKNYFLPRVNIKNYNIEINGRNFYDVTINDPIKKYGEVRKTTTGKGDDYTTGCLLDYAYFEKNHKLIAADISKEKALMLIQELFNRLYLPVK